MTNRIVHYRAPKSNPHPGFPWCKTINAESAKSVKDDDIITANQHRVTCKACVNFLFLGNTMKPEPGSPKVDWFGDE